MTENVEQKSFLNNDDDVARIVHDSNASWDAVEAAIALAKILWKQEHTEEPWDRLVHSSLIELCKRELQRWRK